METRTAENIERQRAMSEVFEIISRLESNGFIDESAGEAIRDAFKYECQSKKMTSTRIREEWLNMMELTWNARVKRRDEDGDNN